MKFRKPTSRPKSAFRHALVWFLGAAGLAGCMGSAGEVELVPESREGIFYTSFEEAQREAQSQNKHILLDMWRPG
jgi:hypothetical protein